MGQMVHGDWDLCLVLKSKQRNYHAVALMIRKGPGVLILLELPVKSEYLVRTIKKQPKTLTTRVYFG